MTEQYHLCLVGTSTRSEPLRSLDLVNTGATIGMEFVYELFPEGFFGCVAIIDINTFVNNDKFDENID